MSFLKHLSHLSNAQGFNAWVAVHGTDQMEREKSVETGSGDFTTISDRNLLLKKRVVRRRFPLSTNPRRGGSKLSQHRLGCAASDQRQIRSHRSGGLDSKLSKNLPPDLQRL
ncbi:O-fucosyltransferase family protein [Corchorus olitorius]|uniref:O-fucosyltransferase family protein n=1 Tax=Corchorus olitorius TaxID=93759 RepID=A0A1R3KGK7_9ROSI|nr:O-fucosyltransferase family protein [Corchorus olitorius]